MTPSRVLQLDIATLLAHDTATLAAVAAMNVHLAKAAFTPSPTLDPLTLTEADFAGYAAISPPAGNQLVYQDPVTGLYTVELKAPLGGYHFQTTGLGQLPQTIFGWWVTDNANAVLYGSGLLPTPIPLSIVGQGFDLPSLVFALLNNSPQ
jgi:hypothetical protein